MGWRYRKTHSIIVFATGAVNNSAINNPLAGKYIEGYIMVTKRTTRRKIVAPPPASPATKSLPTATLGLAMIVLTNYQAEVKQLLGLLMKTFT